MARRKIGKPPVATIATIATQADYTAAVEAAKAAIAEAARAPRTRPMNRAVVKAKLRRGEPLTDGERATVLALLEEQDRPRRRGRPRGTGEQRVIFAAVVALHGSPLNTYRNEATEAAFSKCDAIAEAMRQSGYAKKTSYDGVAAEMKEIRARSIHVVGAQFYTRRLVALCRAAAGQSEPFVEGLAHAAHAVQKYIEPLAVAAGRVARSDEMRALAALAEAMQSEKSEEKQ